MKWKAFFQKRGIREGICVLLIAVMLLGLCYPASAFQVADLENPMQDVKAQDITTLAMGENISGDLVDEDETGELADADISEEINDTEGKNKEQQEIVKRSGVKLSVGFDGHIAKEYKAQKVKTANGLIKAMGIPLAFENR